MALNVRLKRSFPDLSVPNMCIPPSFTPNKWRSFVNPGILKSKAVPGKLILKSKEQDIIWHSSCRGAMEATLLKNIKDRFSNFENSPVPSINIIDIENLVKGRLPFITLDSEGFNNNKIIN